MPQKLENIVQKKGSVLIFTLVVMFTIIVIALGIASVTSIEKKNTLATNKSITAFQVADSGSEVFMNAIKNANPSQLLSSLGCSGSDSSITGSTSGGTYEITFEKEDGTKAICSDTLADVNRIKSVGTYGQTTRAVDVAMAAGCDTGFTKITSELCVENNEHGTANVYTAMEECRLADSHLCDYQEWIQGCRSGLLVNTTEDWEVVAEFTQQSVPVYFRQPYKLGSGGCGNASVPDPGGTEPGYTTVYAYRCCMGI